MIWRATSRSRSPLPPRFDANAPSSDSDDEESEGESGSEIVGAEVEHAERRAVTHCV